MSLFSDLGLILKAIDLYRVYILKQVIDFL